MFIFRRPPAETALRPWLFDDMRRMLIVLLWLACGLPLEGSGQAPATEGSAYGGVLQTPVSPAAAASLPYRWDVELAGLNVFWNNNIIASSPLRWRRQADTLDLSGQLVQGSARRWGALHEELHLLNVLFRLPWREGSWPARRGLVLGAGWNLRGYTSIDRLQYRWADSLKTMTAFLRANALDRDGRGRGVLQQWMEWYATGAVTLLENSAERLAAGATLKLSKGMGAAVADLQAVRVSTEKLPGQASALVFTAASGRYGYSENLEELDDAEGIGDAWSALGNGSPLSIGMDLGISYVRRLPAYIAGFRDDDPARYDWKADIAITDLGRLRYPLGQESRIFHGPQDVDVARFSGLTRDVPNLSAFNDSLEALGDIAPWAGDITISLPTALRLGLDKYVGHHVYLHGAVVLDASFLNPGVDYRVKELSYVMITPRWEILRVGVYAPLYMNIHGSAMAGLAVRLGPLVAGVHDLGWLFSDRPSGGGYLALVIRSLPRKAPDCPTY